MSERRKCAREECFNLAKRDEFCSSYCAKVYYGMVAPRTAKEQRNERDRVRRLEKKYGSHVTVVHPDAMIGRAPGSAGTGKRH